MHELSIARSMIELAAEHARQAGAGHILSLKVRVGALRCVDEELLRGAFEAARVDTPCENAELNIEKVPLFAECTVCSRKYAVKSDHWNCPRCGAQGELSEGGDELELTSMEVES